MSKLYFVVVHHRRRLSLVVKNNDNATMNSLKTVLLKPKNALKYMNSASQVNSMSTTTPFKLKMKSTTSSSMYVEYRDELEEFVTANDW